MRSLVELNRLLAMMDVAVQQVEWRELTSPMEQAAAPVGCMIVAYVTSGTIGADLPGRAERRCGSGTMILVPAALPSSFRAIDGEHPAGLIIALVEVRLSGSGLLDRVKVPIFADLLGAPLVRQAMNELVQLRGGDVSALGVSALSDSLMKTCVLIVLQNFFDRPGIDLKIIGALADQRLATVIAAVLERPGDPHSLAAMAALAGLSRSTFSRLFGEAMGQSPTDSSPRPASITRPSFSGRAARR